MSDATTTDVRKALRAGHAVNPRAIEALADSLDDCEISLARAEAERGRLAVQAVAFEQAVSKMPMKADYVSRRVAVAGAIGVSVVGIAVGVSLGFLIWG